MNTQKKNGFVVALTVACLIFTQSSYANTSWGKTLVVGGIGATISAVLAFAISGDKNKAPANSKSLNAPSTEELEIRIADPIPSPQEIDTPFTINILANQNDFNGRIYLHCNLGAVEPGYVDLVNGQWTGDIKLSEIGKNNVLELRLANDKSKKIAKTGSSTPFDTINKNNAPHEHSTSLTGKITDSNTKPIAGAVVQLFDAHSNQNKPKAHAITDEQGNYKFHGIAPGAFKIAIKKDGYENKTQKTPIALKRTITANAILPCACNANGKVPVLLVPGIMGSYSKEKTPLPWPYPRLSPVSPTWDSGELEMLDPFGQVGWSGLTKALQKQGYTKDCTIFAVPYDWSLSIPSIRDNYLKPWIEKAKKVSGSDKVDIIGHSMGGLVARSYIQSDLYEDDVRKFAMVGTPSKGAAAVYSIWEAGDPITADIISGNTGITNPTAYFYTNTIDYFYKDHGTWTDACKFGAIRRYEPSSCDRNKVYNMAHNNAISSGQLMPTYDTALRDSQSHATIPIAQEENSFLKALNNLKCFNPKGCVDAHGEKYSYKDPLTIFTSDPTGVQTKLFTGINEQTVNSIYVTTPSPDGLYKDGVFQSATDESGDGTVIPESVNINDYLHPDKPLEILTKHSEHSALIGKFTPELVKFITGITHAHGLEATTIAPQKTLAININGRVQPHISSIITTDNSIKNEHSLKLEKDFKIASAGLAINNPDDGKYNIALDSPTHENYELSISYYDGTTNQLFAKRYIGFFDNSSKTFTLTMNNKDYNNPIILDRSFNTPTDLDVENASNKIYLSWQDEIGDTNNDIAYYEIYWKTDTEPYMHLLGITKAEEKSYQTTHDWVNATTNSYAIRAVLKTGKSTFLSQPAFFISQHTKIINKERGATN